MKYKLIKAADHETLEWLLEDLLVKGWEPHGSPFTKSDCIYQAITLKVY